jgi:predicted DNA-binding transcriptional regulator AlpA
MRIVDKSEVSVEALERVLAQALERVLAQVDSKAVVFVPDHRRVISFDEAAKRANIVRRSLERLIAQGEGPAVVHVSKRRRGILETDLEQWLLSRRRPPPGEARKPAAKNGS